MNWSDIVSSDKLQPYEVDEICKIILLGNTQNEVIAKKYKVTNHIINRVYNMVIAYYSQKKKNRNRPSETVMFRGWTHKVYESESDIEKELSLEYRDVVLTGWELNQLNNPTCSDNKPRKRIDFNTFV